MNGIHPATPIGFIGLGRMGHALACSLRRHGVELVVHDIRPEAVQKMAAQGAYGARGAQDAASRCATVFTMLCRGQGSRAR
jgi:3-hydroxyisobutyrate dehydrogenase-like beta-hydroxyacid dehydrogenase